MSHSIDPKSSSPLRASTAWAEMDTGKVTTNPLLAPKELFGEQQAQLLLSSGSNAGQVFTLDPSLGEHTVGRGQGTQVTVEDVETSRYHCKIVVAEIEGERRYVLEDTGSKNGTFVNGALIEGKYVLTPGDRIYVGPNIVLRFSFVDDEEQQLARQLYETSTRDALTKAYNRRYFIERITSELAFAQRHKSRLAVVMFDLDHFKEVNDSHGHLAGDAVLRAVAASVQKLIRAEDVFARYGGEEFVLLVRGISHESVHLVADRVRTTVERLSIPSNGLTLSVTISVGVSSLDEMPPQTTIEALINLADERLYRAKEGGRNRVCSKSD